MRWVHAAMAVLFAYSATLQLNDPDPVWWVAIYLAAAALAAMAAGGYRPPWRRPVALVVTLAALTWALAIAVTNPELPPLTALVQDWQMRQTGIEERRETLGLLVLSLWSAVVAVTGVGRTA
jgi:ribose/xylose/arabinose/galactoside ABC-type transport system permease subunit